jgi:hypothetical protein
MRLDEDAIVGSQVLFDDKGSQAVQ